MSKAIIWPKKNYKILVVAEHQPEAVTPCRPPKKLKG